MFRRKLFKTTVAVLLVLTLCSVTAITASAQTPEETAAAAARSVKEVFSSQVDASQL